MRKAELEEKRVKAEQRKASQQQALIG